MVLVTGSTVTGGVDPGVVGGERIGSVSDTPGTIVAVCWVGVVAEGGIVRVVLVRVVVVEVGETVVLENFE